MTFGPPRRFAAIAALALLLLSPSLRGGQPLAAKKPEVLAQEAAQSWLRLVDQGKYPQSWARSAKVFKEAVAPAKWEEVLSGIRKPLGRLVSRKVNSRELSDKLAGAPDGKYVVTKFDSVFARKTTAVETVTCALDPDGVWRVSGYYVL
jgi:hypothetical protein